MLRRCASKTQTILRRRDNGNMKHAIDIWPTTLEQRTA